MTDADSGRGRSRVRGAGVLAGLLAGAALAGCQGGPPPRQATPSAPTPSAPTPSAPAARTAPAPGAQPGAGQGRVVTGFLAFGDFGNRSGQSSVARAMRRWAATHRIDALVTTGDNVYPNGEPEHYGDALDAPYAVLRRTAPLWVTLGNHDERRGHGDTQLRHLGLPSLPYTKSLPQVQLLFLDGNRVTRAQGRWLDRELSAPGPRHRVVVFHQPAYSCSRHGSTDDVVDRWVPILERHRVSLVLSGHDHNYQRFVSPRGVTYVVTGGGGASLYDVDRDCTDAVRQEARAKAYHFVAVEVHGSGMTVTAVGQDGRVLDTAVLPAAPGPR